MPPPIKLVQQALPGMSQLCDSPERTAGTFLKTAATVFSRWFLVMRAAASRERARQQEYRLAHNLKNKVKVPSRPLELVDLEKQTEEYSESIIRSMFGDEVADYARSRFACALSTGDMRAFKIRLLMLKARNALQGPLQDEFSKWTDRYIEQAEADAGCKPCPGPRRMSRAEKERKRLRKAANDYYEEEWFQDHEEPARPGVENPSPSASPAKGEDDSTSDTPSPRAKKDGGSRKRKASDILSKTVSGSMPPVAGLVSSMYKVMGGATIEDMAALIVEESPADILENASEEKVEKTSPIEKNGPVRGLDDSVTVMPEAPKIQYLETPGRRAYDSVAEVMEDMAAGRAECYKTPGEVVAAMKQGKMMPHEAMLFISAMDKLSGDKKKGRRPATRRAKLEQIPPEEEEIDSEDRFSNRDEGGEGDGAAAYSYNPNGFGGCYQGDYNW